MIVCGSLRLSGNLEGGSIEVYKQSVHQRVFVSTYVLAPSYTIPESDIITCARNCKKMVVYGSLSLIGPASTYAVEEHEEVAGPKLLRAQEPDWDL